MSALPPPDPATRIVASTVPAADLAELDAPAGPSAVATAAWLLIACGLGGAVGSLLPWGQVTTFFGVIAVSGTQGDGKLTLVAGLFVAAVGLLVLRSRATYNLVVLALVASCAIVAVSGYNALNIAGLSSDPDVLGVVDVGYGLWLTLAAGVAGIVGGALLIQRP